MYKQDLLDLLLGDLRVIPFPSDYPFLLPENLLERHKEVLKGPYIVQIMDLKCIQSSLMQQLDELQHENLSITMPQHKHRLLKFTLNDGRQNCLAMEHLPLCELDDTVTLGSKLLIRNVEIRRGVLLLTPKTCKLLYGYVKVLCNDWNYVNRLRGELGLELKKLSKIDESSRKMDMTHTQSKTHISPLQADHSLSYITDTLENELPVSSFKSQVDKPSNLSAETSISRPSTRLISNSRLKTDISMEESRPYDHPNTHTKTKLESLPKAFDYTSDAYPNETLSFSLDFDFESLSRTISVPPLNYLSKILNRDTRETAIFRIKAFIKSLTGKLFISPTGYYSISAWIDDGTASLKVILDTSILETMIGYSPLEFRYNMGYPEGCERNRITLKNAEETLKCIDHIMELEWHRSPELSIVRSLRTLQPNDVKEMLVFLRQSSQFQHLSRSS